MQLFVCCVKFVKMHWSILHCYSFFYWWWYLVNGKCAWVGAGNKQRVPKWKNDEEHTNFPKLQIPVWSANSHYWIVTNSVLHSTLLVSMYRVSTDNGLTSLCALSHCPYTVLGTPKPPPDQHFPSCCKLSFSLRLSSSAGLRRTWGSIHKLQCWELPRRPAKTFTLNVLQKVKKKHLVTRVAERAEGCRGKVMRAKRTKI